MLKNAKLECNTIFHRSLRSKTWRRKHSGKYSEGRNRENHTGQMGGIKKKLT
jgi:hypothetical protein